ncbi:MAG: phosphate-starvation-inducible PsiE family protein [Coriobacteriia bacterium]
METPDEDQPANMHHTPTSGRLRRGVITLQSAVVGMVVDVLVLLVLVMLIWVVVGVAGDVWTAVTARSAHAFKTLSVELLTVFIFIELFHSLTEYMRFQRIRVTNLVDASLAFVLREVWMALYAQEAGWQKILALAALILALGAIRTLAVVYSPSERAADLAEV